jgi:hypothetical protein
MDQKIEITNQEKTQSLIFSQPMPSDEIEKKSILQKDLKQKKNQNNDDQFRNNKTSDIFGLKNAIKKKIKFHKRIKK